MRLKARLTPISIVLIYAVIAAAWIAFSDKLVVLLFEDVGTITLVSTLKGWLFVLATALILYFMIKKHAAEREILLLKEREARIIAQKSVQMRDDFLALASHELRTPLTPLTMYVQLLKRQLSAAPPELLPKTEPLLKALNNTDGELKHLSTLIENLLLIPALTSGKLTLSREEVDLARLVLEAIERHKADAERARSQLTYRLPPEAKGRWDRRRLQQAVEHVISNALKYGAGKPIEISLEADARTAVLKIQDHGIGISEETQGRLFRQFERLVPLEQYGGFGLGLFIVHEIIVAHGGGISVESRPNLGALFVIELPTGR